MACSSCGGGRATYPGGQRTASRGRALTANKNLPWAHVNRGAETRYATEAEARAAVKLFGGEAQKRG